MDGFVKITIDGGMLVKNFDQLQIDQELLEDSGGENFFKKTNRFD